MEPNRASTTPAQTGKQRDEQATPAATNAKPVNLQAHASSSSSSSSSPSSSTISTSTSSEPFTIPVLEPSSFITGKGGGALRSIDQKFTVNPSKGTLSLSIPLPISKSRGNFQPSLALSYDSGAGNGPFGIGWSLSQQSITRQTSSQIPCYNDEDVFVFMGEDLVPLETVEKTVGAYIVKEYAPRVRTEDEIRVEKWSSTTRCGEIFWRTISSCNITSFYGRDSSSLQFENHPTGARIFSWLMCESYDGNGNAIAYSYKIEDDAGLGDLPTNQKALEMAKDPNVRTRARYIKRVMYGNHLPCRDLESWDILPVTENTQWCFSVVFDYGEHDLSYPTTAAVRSWNVRVDRFSSSRSGFEIRHYRLCQRVLMFHHFPEKLGLQDYLVSSMSLSYGENPCGTLLHSCSLNGHAFDGKTQRYLSESMAPLHLTYSTPPPVEQLQMKSMKPTCLQNLGSSKPGVITRWLDLDGEGSPGLLVQMNGAWFFQRNENGINAGLDSASSSTDSGEDSDSGEEESEAEIVDKFGPVRQLRTLPNIQDYSKIAFDDLDGNGLQDLVLVDDYGKISGFHERQPDTDGWSHFQNVDSVPNLNLSDAGFKRIDLTGNGVVDLLMPGEVPGELTWHPSLGKRGFSIKRACEVVQGCDATRISFLGDDHTAVFLADMTGDGLQDILHISMGRVSYFPNQGYGRFGLEVTMFNAPMMDHNGMFSAERIHLLDLDGSGTTDLIYLAASGGATAYYNECGNGFSSATQLPQFPQVSRLSSVFALDILGKGTSCLCWAGPADASTDDVVIRYLDLAPRCKPHLLTSYSDGNGQETRVKYRPSNTFFLRDERQGWRWKTSIPFPVHVVRQVVKCDELEGYTHTTTYGYHEGYYDPIDREFRGFGVVETWEAETLAAFKDQRFKTPVRYTKSWYHTGAPEVSLIPERTFGDPKVTSSLPISHRQSSRREYFRALKGFEFRNEVYVHDGTSRSNVPHSVKELTYNIEVLSEPKHRKDPGVSRVLPQETVSLDYHREQNNPKVQHDMVLARNRYGSVTNSLNLRYGCGQSNIIIREQAEDQSGKKKGEVEQAQIRSQIKSNQELRARTLQGAHYASLTETTYTDVIYEDDSFYKPVVSRSKQTHYTGFNTDGLLEFTTAKQDVIKLFSDCQVSRGKETVTYFRTPDLTGRLPLHKIKYMPVIDQSYDLAITDEQSNSIRVGPADSIGDLLKAGGYVRLEGADWWRPSSRIRFSEEERGELKRARAAFYIPTVQKDPFDNVSTVVMDDYFLLTTQSTNAIGKTTLADNCYRSLQVVEMTDPNSNRSRVGIDLLGDKVTTAQMGKNGQALGDAPDTETGNSSGAYLTSREEAESFIRNPDENAARLLLGGWNTRTLFCRRRLDIGGVSLPRFRIDIVRSEHAHSGREGKVSVQITFLSASQKTLQTTSLVSWEQSKWSVSDNMVHNAAGQPFQIYQPFFANHPGYHHHRDINTPSSFSFIDPVDGQVGMLYANKTWVKTWHTAWSTVSWDGGATLSITDPLEDQHVGYYFRELYGSRDLALWLQRCRSNADMHVQEAANKAAATFAHNCLTTYSSALDVEIARVEQTGSIRNRAMMFEHDAQGNIETECDPLGRIVQQSQYDVLGRPFAVTNMDKGTNIFISDCMDGSLYSAVPDGPAQRTIFDTLRRPIETRVRENPNDVAEIIWTRFIYGDNAADALERNVVGRLTRVEDQAGVREIDAYDFKGNLSSEARRLAVEYKTCIDWDKHESIELGDSVQISTEYDAMNRPVLAIDMLGRKTRRTFDLLGNMASLGSKGPQDTEWTLHTKSTAYTADGLISQREICDGLVTRYMYDEESKLLIRKMTRNSRGGKIEDIEYTYDCAGRLTRASDTAQDTVFFRNRKIQPIKEYTYDASGQLIQARGWEQLRGNGLGVLSSPGSNGAPTPDSRQMVDYTESYIYDDSGNILVMSHQVSDAATQGWVRRYSYEAGSLIEPERRGNRLTGTETAEGFESFTYNATGAIVRMPSFSQISWDCFENMRSITRQVTSDKSLIPETTWFTYDAEGNRVRKVTERAHTTGTGRVVKLKETRYIGTAQSYVVYAGDGTLVRQVTKTSHIHSATGSSPTVSIETLENGKPLMRYLLSPNLEVDDQGKTVSYEEYSPFGASTVIVCGNGIMAPSEFRFASYRRDTETGLYHCGKRYYCPKLARWTGADSLGTSDGPNVYCYCANDPVNYNDPNGTAKQGEEKAQGHKSKWCCSKDGFSIFAKAAWQNSVNALANTSLGVFAAGVALNSTMAQIFANNPPTIDLSNTIQQTMVASLIMYNGASIVSYAGEKLAKFVVSRCSRDPSTYDPDYEAFLLEHAKLRERDGTAADLFLRVFVSDQAKKQGIEPADVDKKLLKIRMKQLEPGEPGELVEPAEIRVDENQENGAPGGTGNDTIKSKPAGSSSFDMEMPHDLSGLKHRNEGAAMKPYIMNINKID